MIAQELEVSLHMAFVEALQKRHEFITVEHLLLALLDQEGGITPALLERTGVTLPAVRQTVEQALAKFGAPVYVFHEIVHNGHVVQGLQCRGAVFGSAEGSAAQR